MNPQSGFHNESLPFSLNPMFSLIFLWLSCKENLRWLHSENERILLMFLVDECGWKISLKAPEKLQKSLKKLVSWLNVYTQNFEAEITFLGRLS